MFGGKPLNLTSENIEEINAMFDWRTGILVRDKLLGKCDVVPGKHTLPAQIPDKRIEKLNELIDLSDKSILEVGCLEGIHTLGLKMFSDNVTAVDVRPENAIKTLARLSACGQHAPVFVMDVEELSSEFGTFDVIFHCGVLYHLSNPAEHILNLGRLCDYLYLDTHISTDGDELINWQVDGIDLQGRIYKEAGWSDPFSGKDATSVWLTKECLLKLLKLAGFASVDVWRVKKERNGDRISLVASK